MSSESNGTEAIPPRPASVSVETGLLSPRELDSVSKQDRASIEEATIELLDRYGVDWLRRERERLRDELQFFYGVSLQPSSGTPGGPRNV
jgi:hypothetical protein